MFDYDKLTWMNGEYIKKMPQPVFIEQAMPYFREVFGTQEKDWTVLAEMLQPRVLKLPEIPEMLAFFKELPDYDAALFVNKKSKANLENAPVMLQAAIEDLEAQQDWSVPSLHDNLLALAQKLGVKNGTLLWPVRIAAAGQKVTPGGAMEILSLLGREESLRRLRLGQDKLREAADTDKI